MTVRVLLAVSGVEDTLFFQDVLAEVEGREYWTEWVHLETLVAEVWEEAEEVLKREPVDVVLLDLGLKIPNPVGRATGPVSVDAASPARRAKPWPVLRDANRVQPSAQGVEAFRRAKAVAPQVPVILLVDSGDIALAELLLREGAQDYLVKSQVDCGPLTHSIRNAIERHRYLESARAAAMTDPLTGLLNRAAFVALAERDRKLAAALGRRMLVAVVEPAAVSEGVQKQQEQDLVLVGAAEHLRGLVRPADLVARIGERSFAIAIFETEERALNDAWLRLADALASIRLDVGAAVFRPESPAPLEDLLEQAKNAQRGSALCAVNG